MTWPARAGSLQARVDALRFGPEGIAGWQGQPQHHGQPVDADTQVRLRQVPDGWQPLHRDIKRQGMAILLFQCPICGATDSIVQRKRLFGADHLVCHACHASWIAKRRPGRDYWLTLVSGPEQIVGLEMSLSQWYEAVKRDLLVEPLPAAAAPPAPDGAPVYLVAQSATLTAHDTSTAHVSAGETAAATKKADEHIALPTKNVVGAGRLLLTERRLQWADDGRTLDFDLEQLRAVHLTFRNVLTIAHGAAWYTFNLGDQSAIKWVAYLDRLLDRVTVAGHPKATISPY